MNKTNMFFIGLETHNDFFDVAYEEDGWDKQTTHWVVFIVDKSIGSNFLEYRIT